MKSQNVIKLLGAGSMFVGIAGCGASNPPAGSPGASPTSTPTSTSAPAPSSSAAAAAIPEAPRPAHGDLYAKAGTIQIRDRRAIMSGTAKSDVLALTLEDVGLYTGHTCGCDTAGFLITKNVLGLLFPGQTPSRSTLTVSISEFNPDLIDSIAFITGVRLNRGEYTGGKSDFVVDKSIAGAEGTTTLVFERKDNGKRIKAVIDRRALLTKDEMRVASVVKDKILKGLASDEEKEEFARTTQAIVRKEITALPEGAFVYTPLN
jgi:hypothetical protein